jgi:hypothetical protein
MRKPYFYSIHQQAELIARASDWRGTPFRPNARAMGVGVDCVQLIAEIYKATGFIQEFAPGEYSMDGGQHAERSRVVEYVEGTGQFAMVWQLGDRNEADPQAGDLLCFKIGKQIHHAGLAVSPLKFFHVYRGYAAKESLFNDATWRKRLQRIYRPVTNEIIPDPKPLPAPEPATKDRVAAEGRELRSVQRARSGTERDKKRRDRGRRMSFLSGSTRKLPQPSPKVAGLDEAKTATAEQARPVPWLCGRQRIGVTFLTQAFDQITEEMKEEISKKDEEVTTGYNYFCSFAALLCGGPVDRVEKIYLDEKEAWSGSLTRGVDGAHFVDITIEGFGEARLYWGTATQEIDPTLATLALPMNSNGVIEYHPAYRGMCYAVFKRFFLGYQRTSAPNIEFVIGRYPDVASIPNEIGSDCSLPAALGDALTDSWMGLGLNSAVYDIPNFAAIGATLSLEAAGLSPLVTRRQPLRQVLLEMCEAVRHFIIQQAAGRSHWGLCGRMQDLSGA